MKPCLHGSFWNVPEKSRTWRSIQDNLGHSGTFHTSHFPSYLSFLCDSIRGSEASKAYLACSSRYSSLSAARAEGLKSHPVTAGIRA
ncbi:hypothetical protein ACFXTH_043873 [Malus domestica]